MESKEARQETSAMAVRCGKLRFLMIDEIEASGADTIGALEEHATFHISSPSRYKYAWKQEDNGTW